jgi:hypothetical protein
MTKRNVIEADFRMPEFRDAKVEDYEFRDGDDKLVRKDRWERGIHKIASILDMNGRTGFEIEDVIAKVVELNAANSAWLTFGDADFDFHLRKEIPPAVDLKFPNGSILCDVERQRDKSFRWNGEPVPDGCAYARFRYSA